MSKKRKMSKRKTAAILGGGIAAKWLITLGVIYYIKKRNAENTEA